MPKLKELNKKVRQAKTKKTPAKTAPKKEGLSEEAVERMIESAVVKAGKAFGEELKNLPPMKVTIPVKKPSSWKVSVTDRDRRGRIAEAEFNPIK